MRRYKLTFAGENTVTGAGSRCGCACAVTKFSLPRGLDEIKAYRGAGRGQFSRGRRTGSAQRGGVFKVSSQLFTRVGRQSSVVARLHRVDRGGWQRARRNAGREIPHRHPGIRPIIVRAGRPTAHDVARRSHHRGRRLHCRRPAHYHGKQSRPHRAKNRRGDCICRGRLSLSGGATGARPL